MAVLFNSEGLVTSVFIQSKEINYTVQVSIVTETCLTESFWDLREEHKLLNIHI